MKFLFDENLSPRLTRLLADAFPDSSHVRNVGLQAADDVAVWEYAKQNDFTIVSKDADFHGRSIVQGFPPKVVWIRLGNCSTAQVATLIKDYTDEIRRFGVDGESSFLRLELSVQQLLDRLPVDSSIIASIGYEAESMTLDIEFRGSGTVYRYFKVPEREYRAFLAADSKGTYLNQQFKKAGYRFVKIL